MCGTIILMKPLVSTLIFISIFCFFGVTKAQQIDLPQTEIGLEISPENPNPNSSVVATINSYGTNLNSASITWRVNGKTQKSGTGEKSISFTVGGENTTTILSVTIKTQEGETIEKTLRIKPVVVDLIWESEGFVPPFYKGKALFTHQNKLTFIAMPHINNSSGVEIGVKNLVYTWKKNGTVIEGASGFGKNTYSFVSSVISRPLVVEVEVSTTNGSVSGYSSMSLSPGEPYVVLYKKDPLFGIEFQKALQGEILLNNSREIQVAGFPMFFGTNNVNSRDLSYSWKINGATIKDIPDQSVLVFRQEENSSGTSAIGLSVENRNKILQFASGGFRLKFGNNE